MLRALIYCLENAGRKAFGAVTMAATFCIISCSGFAATIYPAEQFTAEIDSPHTSFRTLISTSGPWRYYKGASSPNTGWDVADDVFLGGSWLSGASGFGYGDGDDATVLSDMRNSYSSVFARKSFSVDGMINPRRLRLRVDSDDGFVAWLDGKEIARARAPGAVGTPPAHNSLATSAHEASGSSTNPVEVFYVPTSHGAVYRGTPSVNHVLALQGLNRTLDDDDFSLQASLLLDDYFVSLTSSSVALSGQATLPGLSRVTVNNQNATLAGGRWSRTHPLAAGNNRLIIQAWDSGNGLLGSLTNHVVYKPSSVIRSGNISSHTTWGPGGGIIEVSGRIVVANGVTLTVSPGTTILFQPGASIFTSGGTIDISGTAAAPIFLLPVDGRTPWGEIAASGAGSSISLRHTEMVAGRLHITNNVVALLEDSILRDSSHDRFGLEHQIIYSTSFSEVTMRRCTVSRYYEMAFGSRTLARFEDCVVEYAEDDAIKFDDSTPGSYIRRCVVGPSAPGDDAIDFGAGARASVQDTLIHYIEDRGISIGEVAEITVSNCLIHHTGNAIGVKDSSLATIRHVTLADSAIGLAVFEKFDGGGASFATLTNSIIWGNATNLTLRNPEDNTTSGSRVEAGYSIVQGGFSGTANLSSNPQFLNAAQGNYRLAAGSPAVNSGQGSLSRGVLFPVGPRSGLTISEGPASQTIALHGILNLHVVASADSSLSYQWQHNGQNISGQTTPNLTVSDFQANNEGEYRVLINSATESATSTPALVMLNSPVRLSYRVARPEVHFRLSGPAGSNLVLQTSSNFTAWTGVATNRAANGFFETNITLQPNVPARYFRVLLRP